MMATIEVCERLMDYWIDHKGQRQPKYHAQVAGDKGKWACGQGIDEAIGNLVRCHPESFGVTVEYLPKQAR